MDTLKQIHETILEWATEDKLLRSVLILICGMLLFNLPTLIYKIRLFLRGILYFFLCWDKSWKRPTDPGAIFGPHLSQGLPVERKTIYFIRHGESTWNETFNKGKHRTMAVFVLGFVPGLIKAVLYELYLLLSGKLDRYVQIYAETVFATLRCCCVDAHSWLVILGTQLVLRCSAVSIGSLASRRTGLLFERTSNERIRGRSRQNHSSRSRGGKIQNSLFQSSPLCEHNGRWIERSSLSATHG
jgi:hypothetical protein